MISHNINMITSVNLTRTLDMFIPADVEVLGDEDADDDSLLSSKSLSSISSDGRAR